MDDIRGSGHIIAMARSVIGLVLVNDPKNPTPNCPVSMPRPQIQPRSCSQPLGLELVPGRAMPSSSSGVLRLMLKWPFTSRNECRHWLVDLMRSKGELKPADVVLLARQQGFSRSILYQVRASLKKHSSTPVPGTTPRTPGGGRKPDPQILTVCCFFAKGTVRPPWHSH